MYTNFLFDIYMQISKSTSSPFPNQIIAFLFKPIFLLGVHVLSMKLSISVSQDQGSSLTLYTLSHPINKLLFEYISNSSILLCLYYCHLLSYLVLPGSDLAALDLFSVFTLLQGGSFNTRADHDTVLLYLENLEESCCFWIKAKTLSITLKTLNNLILSSQILFTHTPLAFKSPSKETATYYTDFLFFSFYLSCSIL